MYKTGQDKSIQKPDNMVKEIIMDETKSCVLLDHDYEAIQEHKFDPNRLSTEKVFFFF